MSRALYGACSRRLRCGNACDVGSIMKALSARLISSAISSSNRVHDRSAGRPLYVPEHHELAAQPNHITAGALTQPQHKLSFIDP